MPPVPPTETPFPTLVLGGGLVGRVMALDLAADAGRAVTVADRDPATLDACAAAGLATVELDCSDLAAVRRVVDEHGLVVGAMPSHLGLDVLEVVLRAGRPMSDISFMAEDARVHDALARKHGVTAVVDCGVAPGMSNLLAGLAARQLSSCREIMIRVGGLPKERTEPWAYKAPFSPYDVIEEYLRPARIVRKGATVVREALSDLELIEFDEVGALESFNTDGLRSLVDTLDVPHMTEQTMRYPGYTAKIKLLRDSGLLDDTPIDIDGGHTTARAVTCRKLFEQWLLRPEDVDLTIMRVEARGDLQGSPTRLVWDLYDERDPATGFSSMARTTGFPCTIVARCLESGQLDRPGVHPPECLVDDDAFIDHLFAEQAARGVHYRSTQQADGGC